MHGRARQMEAQAQPIERMNLFLLTFAVSPGLLIGK
jgi:hypothetical protein